MSVTRQCGRSGTRAIARASRLWSGRPNGALVVEAADLPPGRVLDVGCGEGADAVWLAGRGWSVTALEVSGVALERAAGHARDAGVSVEWVHAGLAEAVLPAASFDLVSAQYPALLRTPDAAAERALLAAVAPGGLLLLVHHAGMDTQPVHEGGFDPADYVWPAMIAALLDEDWQVEVDEQRPRIVPDGGAGCPPRRRPGAPRAPTSADPTMEFGSSELEVGMSVPTPFEVHESGALLHGTKADLTVGTWWCPGAGGKLRRRAERQPRVRVGHLGRRHLGRRAGSGRGPGPHLRRRTAGQPRGRSQRDGQAVSGQPHQVVPHDGTRSRSSVSWWTGSDTHLTQIQAMRDGLADLERQGKAVIDD